MRTIPSVAGERVIAQDQELFDWQIHNPIPVDTG